MHSNGRYPSIVALLGRYLAMLRHPRYTSPSLRPFVPNSLMVPHRSFLPRAVLATPLSCGSAPSAAIILHTTTAAPSLDQLYYVTLKYITRYSIRRNKKSATLHYSREHRSTLHDFNLSYITLGYITLHYDDNTLRYTVLHYVKLHSCTQY
jgi:hypothetical protein